MWRRSLVTRLASGRLHRFGRLSIAARVGLAVTLGLILLAVFPSLVAPYSPTDIFVGPIAGPPSAQHLFGTDELGRDTFSRVVWGARVSVTVGLAASLLSLLAGAVIGSVAATSGRRMNEVIMRLLDVIIAFPGIILAVVLASVMGPSLPTTIIVLSVLYTPAMARVIRANILVQYGEDYVAAEMAIGAGRGHILIRHVMINAAAPVIVFATVIIADAILLEAALSFISVGIQPPTPSWGNIVNDGRELINSGGWWVTSFGGLAIFVSVLSLNLFAEGMADLFGAPKRLIEQGEAGGIGSTVVPDGVATTASVVDRPAQHVPNVVSAETPPVIRLRRSDNPLLVVEGLSVRFPGSFAGVDVLSDVSLDVGHNEVVGLVGESGSGKSLTGLTIMGLQPSAAEVSARVMFRGENLLEMPAADRRHLLGHEIAMIYQDSLSALNPAMTIDKQLKQLCRRGSRYTPTELLDMVQLSAKSLLRMYPHQLSGGQRQRVLIAMALSRDPSMLIADEPTTALDETVQAQIVDLLQQIRRERNLSILLISHDLALVAGLSDYVVVMYGGRVCEALSSDALTGGPAHPYTDGLLSSIVSLERREQILYQIEGSVPPPHEFSPGCRFVGRCPNQSLLCEERPPVLSEQSAAHWLACNHPVVRESTRLAVR